MIKILPTYKICKKYKDGISTNKLAKEYDCAVNTINKLLRNNYIIIRTKNRLDLPINEICTKYLKNISTNKLAREYGCSQNSINKILRNNNIIIRSTGKVLIELPTEEICKKYLNGINTYALAREYNCGVNTINKRLCDNGIKIRSHSEILTLNLPTEEICKKYLNGMSTYALAEEYGCSKYPIIVRLYDSGIDVSKERSKHHSATLQGVSLCDWKGRISGNWRDYSNAIYLNKLFPNCHRHHITKTIVIHIPIELHKHIYHCLKTGHNMDKINMLALQFINGYYSK